MKEKFGICEWSLPVSSILAIRVTKEAGYDGIQLSEAGGRLMGYPLNNKGIQQLYREAAQEYGIVLHSLNLGDLLKEGNLNFAGETERGGYARKSLEKAFAACCELSIGTIVVTVEPKTEEQAANVIENLRYACELAKTCGVELAIESAQPICEIRQLLDDLDEDVKICLDLLNPLRFQTGNPREQMLAFGRERISHFHVKDAPASLFQPGERGCVSLGTGDGGYRESVETIKGLAYRGWIITENYYYLPPMNDGDEDFLELAKKDLTTMKGSFSERL